ncbi:MAG: hypothetical protein RL329_860 [Bacteroidota bacterium]|jgi:hypothetical protein
MKSIVVAAVLAAFTFTACQKENVNLLDAPVIHQVTAPQSPQIPEVAAKWLSDNYPDYNIVKTTLTRAPEEFLYKVTIKNVILAEQKTIIFDSDGAFLNIL